MRRPAIIAASLSGAVCFAAVVIFTLDPHEFSTTAVALIGIGMVACTLVALVGFLLVRGGWGRWALIASLGVSMLLTSAADASVVLIVYALGAISITALVGPWLRFWTRKLPSPDSPGPVPVLLMAIAPIAPLAIGVGAYSSNAWQLWFATGLIVGSSLAYGWAIPGAIWLVRIVVPFAGAVAFLASPLLWALATAALTIAATVLAWTPAAAHTVSVPSPVLPTPVPTQRGDATDASG